MKLRPVCALCVGHDPRCPRCRGSRFEPPVPRAADVLIVSKRERRRLKRDAA